MGKCKFLKTCGWYDKESITCNKDNGMYYANGTEPAGCWRRNQEELENKNKQLKVKTVFGSHQIYQEIANYPPEGINYVNISKGTKQGTYYKYKKIKEFLSLTLRKFSIPRMIFLQKNNCDIIHTSRGIIPLNKISWVMDIEHVHSFYSLDSIPLTKERNKRFIEKKLSSKYCKSALCHCEATRQSFFHFLNCENFKNKIKVLYPASHTISIRKRPHKKIIILCVLSLFKQKGGIQILKAFTKLEKKYKNIELRMRADVPINIKEKFNSKNIKYTSYLNNIISRKELIQKEYAKADIFVYPTFCDSFGYSLIDALVAKLPIVTTNMFASPEVVENNKNGFVIDIPGYFLKEDYKQYFHFSKLTEEEKNQFNDNLTNSIEKLIKDKNLRIQMGKNSFEKVKNGKFSIKERNKKLKKIYEGALK